MTTGGRAQITGIFAESQLGHFLSIIQAEKKARRKGAVTHERHLRAPSHDVSNERFLGLKVSKMPLRVRERFAGLMLLRDDGAKRCYLPTAKR